MSLFFAMFHLLFLFLVSGEIESPPRHRRLLGGPVANGVKKKGLGSLELELIITASLIVIILMVLIIIYFYMKKLNHTSRVVETVLSPPRSGTEHLVIFKDTGVPLTFETVIHATGNFSLRNCIGSGGFGSTYRAEMCPGTTVAVKRLTVEMFQGVPQFNAEIRSLQRIEHPNLITLIGYCASSSEMFLVYNYLPGGSLEDFIRIKKKSVTGVQTVVKIAINVADALAYLHDKCNPRVLHRDVKPSNVLLDDDWNAYLSDFGLSRLLEGFKTHVTTGVAGTFGYVAPEYALACRVSDRADVYSYGVMLLELVSDKRALDPSFSAEQNGYTIVSWVEMLRREGRMTEAFAAEMWEVGAEKVLPDLLQLGLNCTAETASERPSMRHVVRKLKEIQRAFDRICEKKNLHFVTVNTKHPPNRSRIVENADQRTSTPFTGYITMVEGARVRLRGWQQAAVALGSAVGALVDPRRADLIAALGETTGKPAFERVLERMKRNPEGREILLDRPRVISSNVGHVWDLPENTFGAAYAKFMGSRNFSPDDRPPVRFMETEELAYVAMRAREVHDFWHTLFGLPTNLIGESALKVIEFEQMLLPMCFLSVIGGTARFNDRQRSLFYTHYFPWAVRAGMKSTDLMCVYYEKHFHEDLEVVRQRWGIVPAPSIQW
ncbi:hypothetical protein L1987_79333 [Smallanthus sonchifolius]|uniref:Uncharacterized protein n=1 Tax=Smallanthus sonchifolius TaxID=185202 RepID=A0ACB8ZF13_9ASTR|nr:hypothetical protein L1987_79333 [Smallanthus sonchifolius]